MYGAERHKIHHRASEVAVPPKSHWLSVSMVKVFAATPHRQSAGI